MGILAKTSRHRSAKPKVCYSLVGSSYARRLRVEELEDRRMLATVIVNTDQDIVDFRDGVLSLREAVFAVNVVPGADEIVFDFGHDQPTTILLTQGDLQITDALEISGPGAEQLTIDATGNDPTPTADNGDGTRVFTIDDGNDENHLAVTIRGVTLTGGDIRQGGGFTGGGAIVSRESLQLVSSVITGNWGRNGGGVAIQGIGDSSSAIVDSKIVGNSSFVDYSSSQGGGIFFNLRDASRLTISGSTIRENMSSDGSGIHGVARDESLATIETNVVADNIGSDGIGMRVGTNGMGQLTVRANTITGNTRLAADQFYQSAGGGILAQSDENSSISIIGNLIQGNTANYGAGLDVQSSGASSLTVDGNTISGNEGAYIGGGIQATAIRDSQLQIIRNEVTDNLAGGILTGGFLRDGLLTVAENKITGNTAADGAGIFAVPGSQDSQVFEGNTISDNHASRNGGGVFLHGDGSGGAVFRRNTITNNSAVENGGGMFAVVRDWTTLLITSTTIAGNSAARGGGIFSVAGDQGVMTVEQSTINDNSAHDGGGWFSDSFDAGKVTLRSSTISGNAADRRGGGIYIEQFASHRFSAEHSTVTVNSADADQDGDGAGGGLFVYGNAIELDHTIVAGNHDHASQADEVAGVFNSRFSLIGFGADKLGSLADNGGPTQTHALLPGSPAIDGGDNNLADPPGFDQRGEPFLRMSGNAIDIGAFEAVPLIVNSIHDTDDGDIYNGTTTLREAINFANRIVGADEILFDSTLRNQTITLEGTELPITDGLKISGQRKFFGSVTDLGISIDGNKQTRIFNIDDPDLIDENFDVHLTNLSLNGGRTTGDNDDFDDSTFSGGAIRSLTLGMLRVERSTLSGNGTLGSVADGGAIFALGPVTINESTISENFTTANSAQGGGIFTAIGTLMVNKSTITNNWTQGDFASGGGIRAQGAVTLLESSLAANHTTGSSAKGGGISANQMLLLDRSAVHGNFTTNSIADGGGIFAGATVTLVQSTVSDNSTSGAESDGGGVFAFGEVTVFQSTVSGNRITGAESSGAGIRADALVSVSHSTITDNHALAPESVGGGIWNNNHTKEIYNSIIAHNTAGSSGFDLEPGTGDLTIDYSLIGIADDLTILGDIGNLTGTTVDPLDPQLAPLANNGGLTATHAPLPGSAVFDAGDPSLVFDPLQFDQRGEPFSRVFGGAVDIGAYETERFVVNSIGDEQDDLPNNGLTTLREAIDLSNAIDGPGLIEFSPAVFGTQQTIAINSQLPQIFDSLTIAGTGADQLTINAGHGEDGIPATGDGYRLFNINDFDQRAIREVRLSGLTLTGGDLQASSSYGGGAIRNRESLIISDVVISGNAVSGGRNASGGGISNVGGNLVITGSTISDNTTFGNDASGGGVANTGSAGNLLIFGSTITGNSTVGENSTGGGVSNQGSHLSVTGSLIAGNTTAGNFAGGGGIFSASTLTLINSTISGNQTLGGESNGGGIFVRFDTLVIGHSTITDNSTMGVSTVGGGIFQYDLQNNFPISISESIIAQNSADNQGSDLVPDPESSLTVNFSLLGIADGLAFAGEPANQTGTLANPLDPRLGPLANNGGLTKTRAFLPGSSALDAGDPNVESASDFDQRGTPFQRIVGDAIDLGAYEAQIAPSADFDADGDVDGSDFLAWQRGFGKANAQPADGNSDDDTDADASDLAAWTVSFGVGAQTVPVTTASSGQEDARSVPSGLAAISEALIDVAMALDSRDGELNEETSFVAERASLEALLATSNGPNELPSTASLAGDAHPTSVNSSAVAAADKPWLADELLERVFG